MVLRVVISGIISAVIMLLLSICWHGVILNDFNFHFTSLSKFVLDYSMVCLVLGGFFSYLFEAFRFKEGRALKRFGVGMLMGAVVFTVAYISQRTFGSTSNVIVMLDFFWQVFEQGVGALVVHLSRHLLFINPDGYFKKIFLD